MISHSSLESFLAKFSQDDVPGVNTLDPLNTFDVKFDFYPVEVQGQGSPSFVKDVAINLGLLDNTTPQIINKSLIELDFSLYVTDITLPQINLTGDSTVDVVSVGKFKTPGTTVGPDNNQLVISFLNTSIPLIERIFYPWAREVALPYWSYEQQPFTTARVIIDFTKHNATRYIFTGVRPTTMQLQQPSQEQAGNAIKRQVTFIFDYIFIQKVDEVGDDYNTDSNRILGTIPEAGPEPLFSGVATPILDEATPAQTTDQLMSQQQLFKQATSKNNSQTSNRRSTSSSKKTTKPTSAERAAAARKKIASWG